MGKITIASRGSPLALQQAQFVEKSIRRLHADVSTRIQAIRTTGDKLSMAQISGTGTRVKGLFIKEIEEALLSGQADLAVHSLKDLPTELPAGLCLGAIPKREDPRDALISASRIHSIQELPKCANVGTSSLRRRIQLEFLRADLQISDIRGNVETRIRKVAETDLDAVILAVAGLNRLGLQQRMDYIFSTEDMVPAPGQGALAIEVRSTDQFIRQIVKPLDHEPTNLCVHAERQFLERLGGDCRFPIGANATINNGQAKFIAFLGSPTNGEVIHKRLSGKSEQLLKLSQDALDYVLSHGGQNILNEFQS